MAPIHIPAQPEEFGNVVSARAPKQVEKKGYLGIYHLHYPNKQQIFLENTELLQDSIEIGQSIGLTVYVITPGQLRPQENQVVGWTYDSVQGWRKEKFPWPDVWMSKVTYYPMNQKQQILHDQNSLTMSHSIPLSVPIQSKWALQRRLKRVGTLKGHLPHTELVEHAQQLYILIQKYGSVYIKPVFGTKGYHIFRVSEGKSGLVLDRLEKNGKTHTEVIPRSAFLRKARELWLGPRRFLVQEAIGLLQERDGGLVDFRWLVQKDSNGEWTVTARVVRIGSLDSFITNLSQGGNVQLASDFVLDHQNYKGRRWKKLIEELDRIALSAATVLEVDNPTVCEAGVDLALDNAGRSWVIEVNPRPGRKMLRRIDPELRTLSLLKPLEYAKYALIQGSE